MDGTEFTVKFQGFIHPLDATSSNGPPLKVFLVTVAAHAALWMSWDASVENKVSTYICGDERSETQPLSWCVDMNSTRPCL